MERQGILGYIREQNDKMQKDILSTQQQIQSYVFDQDIVERDRIKASLSEGDIPEKIIEIIARNIPELNETAKRQLEIFLYETLLNNLQEEKLLSPTQVSSLGI